MKKLISILSIIVIVFSSCSNEKSLNKYISEKSGQEGFMSLTIPATILTLKEASTDKETEEAMASFERLNILVVRQTDSLKFDYDSELKSLEAILAEENLNEMMSMNVKGHYVTINYKGDDNNISEVIVFGKGKEGFALGRVTGKNITAEKIVKVASSVDLSNSDLGKLGNLSFQ